jgi:phage shock protein A
VGILKRAKQIISLNINQLVESAATPETMIEQLIREMEQIVMNLRMEVARAISEEKGLARRINDMRHEIQARQEKIETAVSEGEDDRARTLIAKKLDEEKALKELGSQHKKAVALSETMKKDLGSLEGKTQEVKRQKETLSVRKNSAKVQKSGINSIKKFSISSRETNDLLGKSTPSSRRLHDNLEKEINGIETEMEVMREMTASKFTLEETFDDIERKERIEEILNETQAKLKTRLR